MLNSGACLDCFCFICFVQGPFAHAAWIFNSVRTDAAMRSRCCWFGRVCVCRGLSTSAIGVFLNKRASEREARKVLEFWFERVRSLGESMSGETRATEDGEQQDYR